MHVKNECEWKRYYAPIYCANTFRMDDSKYVVYDFAHYFVHYGWVFQLSERIYENEIQFIG